MPFTKNKILKNFKLTLNDLIFKAQNIHRKTFKNADVQLASLVSIKTGSCPEDCKYCPQSAHFNVDIKKEKLMDFSDSKKQRIKRKKMVLIDFVWEQLGRNLTTVHNLIQY